MSHVRFLTLSLCTVLFCSAFAMAYGPVPDNNAEVDTLLLFPVTTNSTLVSFDWDSTGVLHYTTGDPNYGTMLEVYKASEGGDELLFSNPDVWTGSRLTRLGNYMLFNDGGNLSRSDFNYYGYDAAYPTAVYDLLEAPFEASLWGLETRHDGEFFASGSPFTWGPGALFYGQMDASGQIATRPLVQFGEVGDSPGPLCFDGHGTLYYVPGYAFDGNARIYRWTAEEVTAALADPVNHSLAIDGHEWNVLPAPYDGATGMCCDGFGNVYVTATAWGAPSQLLLFNAPSSVPVVVATYEGRLETLRYKDRSVAVSCAAGIFSVPLLSINSGTGDQDFAAVVGETVVFAVDVQGGIGERHYQWFMQSADKTAEAVGTDASFYAHSVTEFDEGKSFYCEVSDASCTLQSPHFTLSLQKTVPATSYFSLMLIVVFLALAALVTVRRSSKQC